MNELDLIALTRDVPEHRLRAGDVGTVVMLHGHDACEVEFATLTGETLAVLTLPVDAIRPFTPREIAHVREVA